jgi:hypothetical protein
MDLMEECTCAIVAKEELRRLLQSDDPGRKDEAVAYLVGLLTSHDEPTRARGYELLEEGINDALFCSCFNYGSLVGGFTHSFLTVVMRAVEQDTLLGRADG